MTTNVPQFRRPPAPSEKQLVRFCLSLLLLVNYMKIEITDNSLILKVVTPEEYKLLFAIAAAYVTFENVMNPGLDKVPHSTLAHENEPGRVRLSQVGKWTYEEHPNEKNHV